MKRNKTIVIGLTGSIGMGKSTCARMMSKLGLAVLSADQIVHGLLAKGGAAEKKIARLYPFTSGPTGINRTKLAALVFQDPAKLAWLEGLLHPLVFKKCQAFIRAERKKKTAGVVLEIPLLFETGFDAACDVTVCVSASSRIQKARVLARKHMTPQKMRAFLKKQWPDALKRERADYIIRTDKNIPDTRRQIKLLWQSIQQT